MDTEIFKCNGCKLNKELRFFMSKNNKLLKRCDTCRNKYKCEHNRQKSRCVECEGSGICIHKKIKSQCILMIGNQKIVKHVELD